MIHGQVPWRCLVPSDAVNDIVGRHGANLQVLTESSGAVIKISQEGETPATLADKIVSFGGLVEQKENACAQIVRMLRQMQGVRDNEPGVFVIIVPQISAPVIVGAKGAQIRSIMEQSGAEVNVGREAIIGMPDQPISINGTLDQVVSAVSKLNGVLQDMADRGKLHDRDFIYRLQDEGADSAEEYANAGCDTGPTQPSRSMDSRPINSKDGLFDANGARIPAGLAPPFISKDKLSPEVGARAPPGTPAGVSQPVAAQAAGPVAGSAHPSSSSSGGPSVCNAAAGASGLCGANARAVGSSGSSSFAPRGDGTTSGLGVGGGQHANLQGERPGGYGGTSCGPHPSQSGGTTSSGPAGMAPAMSSAPTSFGSGGTPGVGSMGMGCGISSPIGMGSLMGVGSPIGLAATGHPLLPGMGMLNPMMGGMGVMGGMASSNERAFFSALEASGIHNVQLTLLLPQALVQNVLVPRGFMADICQRSGAKIDLGSETPMGMRQVTLSGTMVANSLASLFLQEKVIQFQQIGQIY